MVSGLNGPPELYTRILDAKIKFIFGHIFIEFTILSINSTISFSEFSPPGKGLAK